MMESRRLQSLPERFPLYCQWEITYRCNLHCVMCYTDCLNAPEKIRQELSTVEIFRILNELAEAGVVELCFTGGEPLARHDFFEIYEYAKGKGFLVTVFSNGTLITEEVADRFAVLSPFRVEISLHGITKDTFESVTTGKGSYERCLKAIQLLLERNIPLVLKCAAMTINKDEVFEIKRFAESFGPRVDFRLGDTISPALDGSTGVQRFELSDEAIDALEFQDEEVWKEACAQKASKPKCNSGMYRFHIDAYGQLQLCGGNRRQSYDLRNGSFKEGFYEFLPKFPCPFKIGGCIEGSLCGNNAV